MQERRKWPRAALLSEVLIRRAGPGAAEESVWGLDLSEAGIRLLACESLLLRTGEEIQVHIAFPGEAEQVSLEGRVVWIQPGAQVGIHFDDDQPLARARVLKVVTERRLAALTGVPTLWCFVPEAHAGLSRGQDDTSASPLSRSSLAPRTPSESSTPYGLSC